MKVATRDALLAWLKGLSERADLIAPCDVDGHVLYRPVSAVEEILLDYERPELSAKQVVLPATEVILRIERQGSDAAVAESLPEREQVVFGVRPCDAHGMAVLDALFLDQKPVDASYQHNRQRTTLIGLACRQMWEGCFCTSMGGGPDDSTHLDVMLREVEGGYAAEAVTSKGAEILKDLETKTRKGKPAASAVDAEVVPLTEPEGWRPLFESDLWRRHGERCLSCRICTYVCPTCRCFDVVDRVVERGRDVTRIERVRVWDACTSPNYRRVAGGHNPRATKPDRLRNRFFCKFCYYPEDFGPVGCVGCGRCVVSCPVDIDIREVMKDVAEG
jgi:sulfhydrogenase subunit beta (sulfur reductase)